MSHVANSMIGAGFSPVSVGNCVLWLHAGSLTLADNDPVATWKDSSGTGNDATQGTSGKQPTYKASVNGKPVVRFDGSAPPNADGLRFSGIALGTAHTVFWVLNYTDVSVSRPLFGAATSPGIFGYRENTGPKWQISVSGSAVEVDFNMSVSTWYVAEIYRSGTSVEFFVNGTQVGTTQTLGNNNTITLDVFGWTYGNDDSSRFYGDLAETLIYTAALSTTNRQRIRRYLGAKYGITVA